MAKKRLEDMTAEELIAAQNARVGNTLEKPIVYENQVGDPITGDQEAPGPIPPTPETGPGEVAGTPDPWVVMNRMAAAIEALAARPAGGSEDSKAIQVLTEAMVRMTGASLEGTRAIVDENRKAFRPSNQVIPELSVFSRRGRDPQPMGTSKDEMALHQATIKPKLKCDMHIPWVAEWESLTREEVQLLNLLEDGAYVVKRADRSKVTMTVRIRYAEDNRTPSILFINHETAFNQDNFRNMPPLSDMLRDMLKQHDRPVAQRAAAVLTDEEEEAMIETGMLSVTQ